MREDGRIEKHGREDDRGKRGRKDDMMSLGTQHYEEDEKNKQNKTPKEQNKRLD